jgi:RNA polymerase sigma-70 factor (ECF subfamily)
MTQSLFPARPAKSEPDWESLYADHLPRIYRFFCYRVSDGPTAEDLTSATFEKAWRARQRYRHDLAAFTTWLFAIARNVANDHYRQHRDHVRLDDVREHSREPSPEDVAQQQDDFARLTHLMAQIPERDREVLALKFGAELGHGDIARLMGLSESNVAVIAHRAVEKLRAQW